MTIFSLITKLKSPLIYYFHEDTVDVSYGNLDQSAKLNVRQSVLFVKTPNLMYSKYTTRTVYPLQSYILRTIGDFKGGHSPPW